MTRGIVMRAVRKFRVQNGIHFQIYAMTFDPSPSQRLLNHSGPSMPDSADNKPSTRPRSPISIQWNEMQVCTAASAHGKIYIASRILVHRRGRRKKPDSSKAKNIFMFTPRPTKTEVLTTVGK